MSSYFPSFSYLNQNSQNDFGLVVASLDSDNGEMDSGMSQEQIYVDSYRGTKRLLYGTRYNSTPTIKITVVKCSGSDFQTEECRVLYRWLVGNPSASWLDMYVGDELQYSFLGTVQDVKPYKIDARTVALVIYFESLSPWAYSAVQYVGLSLDKSIASDQSGIIGDKSGFFIDDRGVLCNVSPLSLTNDGAMYIDNTGPVTMENLTDDLYTPVYLNTIIHNGIGSNCTIKNVTLDEETTLTRLSANEVITLNENQFITSDIPGKMFGDTFNFTWPRLGPGMNEFIIDSDGNGSVEFSYRYPIKIGDCAMNTLDVLEESGCGALCRINEPDLYAMLEAVLT